MYVRVRIVEKEATIAEKEVISVGGTCPEAISQSEREKKVTCPPLSFRSKFFKTTWRPCSDIGQRKWREC